MCSLLQFILVIVLTVTSITSNPLNTFNDEPLIPKCESSRCTKPDPNKLNIHLVPHTHDDVGWLKTVDQLYYGANSYIQKSGVQYIIDSVVNSLLQNEKRRFIYVETAFFWKWWKQQNDMIKGSVKELVANGMKVFSYSFEKKSHLNRDFYTLYFESL
jgi:lysosomal alpha-mannosidase